MRTVDPALRPVVEGWELTRLLGVGGSAQVWHAVPVGGGEPAAVKLLSLADGTAPGAAAAEAALLSGLDHPHLIGLREVVSMRWPGTDRPGIALALDLAEAGSLADLLRRRGRLAPGEVVTAVAPVALALAHVHEQAFVHGDVTPGNLLFSAEGVPLLADLGVARVVGGYGEVRTTAAYADPVVAGGGRPSTASDVFMLAATAFHALTGAPPWPDPLPGVALARAARADVRPLHSALAQVPGAVADVLLEGLRPEPHLRPSAAAFALDLGRAARPLAVDFEAGRAVRTDGSELPVWTGSPLPTGERETFAVEPVVAVESDVRTGRRVRADRADRAGLLGRRGRAAGYGRDAGRGRDERRADAARDGAGERNGRRMVVGSVIGLVVAGGVVAGGLLLPERDHVSSPVPVAAVPVSSSASSSASSAGAPSAGAPSASAGSPASGAPATPAVVTWSDVLTGLDRWRTAAYAAGDPASLAQVYVAPALLSADRTTLTTQVPTGCGLQGVRTTYREVTAATPSTPADRPATVVLRATAELAPSVLRCPGRADAPVGGLGPTTLSITLQATGTGYRISAQSPA